LFHRNLERFNQRITLQKFNSFQSIDPDIVAAEHRLDVVHLDFVGRWAIKNKYVVN